MSISCELRGYQTRNDMQINIPEQLNTRSMYVLLGQIFDEEGVFRSNQYELNFSECDEVDNLGLLILDTISLRMYFAGILMQFTATDNLPASVRTILLSLASSVQHTVNNEEFAVGLGNHMRLFRIQIATYETWLQKTFNNWLAQTLYTSALVVAPQTYLFRALFENAKQYAGIEWASVLCQHEKTRQEITLVLSDAGQSIPSTIRDSWKDGISDEIAIAKAIEDGRVATAGDQSLRAEGGLGKLVRNIVDQRMGNITITSGFGRLHCAPVASGKVHRFEPANAFFPGTMIEVSFSTELFGFTSTLNEPLAKVDLSLK